MIDIEALIAELERHRAKNANIEARLAEERAAVLEWLRVEMDYMLAHDLTGGPMHMRGLIEGIERGEHRPEEKKP